MNESNPLTPKAIFNQLEQTVRREQFAGWDPYDGLNSRVFRATPLDHWL